MDNLKMLRKQNLAVYENSEMINIVLSCRRRNNVQKNKKLKSRQAIPSNLPYNCIAYMRTYHTKLEYSYK